MFILINNFVTRQQWGNPNNLEYIYNMKKMTDIRLTIGKEHMPHDISKIINNLMIFREVTYIL